VSGVAIAAFRSPRHVLHLDAADRSPLAGVDWVSDPPAALPLVPRGRRSRRSTIDGRWGASRAPARQPEHRVVQDLRAEARGPCWRDSSPPGDIRWTVIRRSPCRSGVSDGGRPRDASSRTSHAEPVFGGPEGPRPAGGVSSLRMMSRWCPSPCLAEARLGEGPSPPRPVPRRSEARVRGGHAGTSAPVSRMARTRRPPAEAGSIPGPGLPTLGRLPVLLVRLARHTRCSARLTGGSEAGPPTSTAAPPAAGRPKSAARLLELMPGPRAMGRRWGRLAVHTEVWSRLATCRLSGSGASSPFTGRQRPGPKPRARVAGCWRRILAAEGAP
jgi:hypothetical protein